MSSYRIARLLGLVSFCLIGVSIHAQELAGSELRIGSDGNSSVKIPQLRLENYAADSRGASHLRLKLPPVAASLSPSSVALEIVNAPKGWRVGSISLPQRPLLNQLLGASVGNEVVIVRNPGATGSPADSSKAERVKATVLDESGLFSLSSGELITGIALHQIQFPVGLLQRLQYPSVMITGEGANPDRAGELRFVLSGVSNQFGFQASHRLIIPDRDLGDRAPFTATISAGATIRNESLFDFPSANLRLIAGERGRVSEEAELSDQAFRGQKGFAMAAVQDSAEAAPAVQAAGELYEYQLPEPVDLLRQSLTTVPLSLPAEVKVSARFELLGVPQWWGVSQSASEEVLPVNLQLELVNAGNPLPAGIVRAYQQGKQGDLALLGETSVRHTGAGQKVLLNTAQVFDLRGTRSQKSFRRENETTTVSSWEVKLESARKTSTTVTVVEQLGVGWTIVDSTFKAVPRGAQAVAFEVPVKAGDSAVLRYTVRHSTAEM